MQLHRQHQSAWGAACGSRPPAVVHSACAHVSEDRAQRSRRRVAARALTTPPPDYTEVDAQPLNRVIMGLFRRKMVAAIGSDVPSVG